MLNVGSSAGKKRKVTGRKAGLKKKIPTWSHTFICLAYSSQDTLPDGEERASLQKAGLGEKNISFCAFGDAQDIYDELLFQFPKLCEAGGLELRRIPEGGGKELDVIAAPDSGYTVSYLRAVVHHAKIYIRLMQRNLSLDPVKEDVRMCIITLTTWLYTYLL